jgi:LuxR family maltose regulon positive regulatory protein
VARADRRDTHLDARAPAEAAERTLRLAGDAGPDLDTLRASAEQLASTQGVGDEPFTPAPDDEQRTQPALAALLHASRGTAEFANPNGVDVDVARTELERALAMARAHDLAYLEVQTLYILATVAAVHGDLRGMRATAEQAVAAAARRGRHPSGWSAAPAGLLAYADLLAGRPAAAAARSDEALGTWDLLPPEAAYTLHAVHGAAFAD